MMRWLFRRIDLRPACEWLTTKLKLGKEIFRDDAGVYLRRYWIFKRPSWAPQWVPNVYLHHFLRGDDDLELHNHPWSTSRSLVLAGGYLEERRVNGSASAYGKYLSAAVHDFVAKRYVLPGDTNTIHADTFHRVELIDEDCWTVFITGARCQGWSFWCRNTGRLESPEVHGARKARLRRWGAYADEIANVDVLERYGMSS